MSKIMAFTYDKQAIRYMIVKGEVWFNGTNIATILCFSSPEEAVAENLPDNFKMSISDTYGMLSDDSDDEDDYNTPFKDTKSIYINEAGLFKLILRSKYKNAEKFTDHICSEVLPSIRKYGSYMSHIDALNAVNKPKGESKLHYDVVSYIRRKYPDVIISAGLGENQVTEFMRLDSQKKGYTKGELDIELKCKLENGYTDVFVIELKNPNGKNFLSKEQKQYMEKLRQINVKTIWNRDYNQIIKSIDKHYENIQQKISSF